MIMKKVAKITPKVTLTHIGIVRLPLTFSIPTVKMKNHQDINKTTIKIKNMKNIKIKNMTNIKIKT